MDGIVHSNSGGGFSNPAVRRGQGTGPREPVVLVLDAAAGRTATVGLAVVEGRSTVVLAFHDPARAQAPGEDEVYALPLVPDRAWELGSTLTRLAQAARDVRSATEPGA
jgi:hypothetical protein